LVALSVFTIYNCRYTTRQIHTVVGVINSPVELNSPPTELHMDNMSLCVFQKDCKHFL